MKERLLFGKHNYHKSTGKSLKLTVIQISLMNNSEIIFLDMKIQINHQQTDDVSEAKL